MDWPDLRQGYLALLNEKGFRPEIDSDGDVHFTYEGGHYFVTNNCDDTYFHLLYPGFWSLGNRDEQVAGLLAANATNRRMKVAKILLNSDLTRASVTLECFIGQASDVGSFLMRALRCIQQTVDVFREEYGSIAN